jgi:hypothetical protein
MFNVLLIVHSIEPPFDPVPGITTTPNLPQLATPWQP